MKKKVVIIDDSMYMRSMISEALESTENFEIVADQIAMAMFKSLSGVRDVGQVSIVISYGYDIMISHVRTTKAFVHSPGEWLKRLRIDEPTSAAPQV